tara:strand:- start:21454 stop:21597 length:144 start_codon:yes stop_codon:yes gene_type:complete
MSDDLKKELIFDFEEFGTIEHTTIDDVDFSDDSVQISYAKTARTLIN